MNLTTLGLLFASVIAGAIVVEIFKPKKSRNIQILLTFSGAYLLAVSLLHLLPELFHHNTTPNIGLFILGGFLIQILLEYFSQGIEHGHFHKSNIIPFSVLISLCLHALLEGVPLGGDLQEHTHNALLYGIVLHKLPVAIVLMTFFLQSGMRKQRAYIFLLIFALMAPLGVYAGNIFGALSNFHNEIMAIVIGIFLHISTTILFESTDGHRFSFTKIITIIIGTLLAILSL
ncbi:MAG TPA: ZIP family metal transporter [Flavobacteriales bacterium]|jgi:zinc transporter ZupT|nr:ZIP family metal transporter [Flavobacteriales bacterium]|tara:strand:+ start:514 stop:1206 length:693 start_codon:yes stop_codon:yes gene_type:complete